MIHGHDFKNGARFGKMTITYRVDLDEGKHTEKDLDLAVAQYETIMDEIEELIRQHIFPPKYPIAAQIITER